MLLTKQCVFELKYNLVGNLLIVNILMLSSQTNNYYQCLTTPINLYG